MSAAGLRILLACELYYPSVGGVQEVMRQIGERLAGRGHRVTVATSHLPERTAQRVNGVEIREFRAGGNLVAGLRGNIEGYRAFVLRGEYDVLLVKAAQQWTFDALLPVLGRISKPKVFVPCGFSSLYEPAFADYYRSMPDALKAFDRLIFYASDYRDINFARQHGLTRFAIVPNGADEREFSVPRDAGFRARHGIAGDSFVVLTVGALTGQKGHAEVAEAFARATFPGGAATLLLNGNAPFAPAAPAPAAPGIGARVKNLYAKEGIPGVARGIARRLRRTASAELSVREALEAAVAGINRRDGRRRALLVDLPRPELVQAFLNSDLFVFASAIEYSPLVLFEAAAAGLPFLTIPVGNSQEIAAWTGGGVICPAGRDERGYTKVEPAALAERMSSLASDRGRLAALGEAGREAWRRRFTWDAIAVQYEAILDSVANENPVQHERHQ